MNSRIKHSVESKQIALWESGQLSMPVPYLKYQRNLIDIQSREKAPGHIGDITEVVVPPVGAELTNAGFSNWGDVASTIYNKMLDISAFDPTNIDDQPQEFLKFQRLYATCPYWNGLDFGIEDRCPKITSDNFNEAIDGIEDMLDFFITPSVKQKIISSIKKIAELAARNENQTQKTSLFNNGVISGNNQGLYVFFIYTYVEMIENDGKCEAIDQQLQVVAAHGKLNTDFCNRHASDIIKYDTQILDDWESGSASANMDENDSSGWPS